MLRPLAVAAALTFAVPALAQDWFAGRPYYDPWPRWDSVLARGHGLEDHADWRRMLDEARGMPSLAQLEHVHRWWGRLDWRSDLEVHGVLDRWEAPGAFLERGAGDCEEFAIATWTTLVYLGHGDRSRVALVWDHATDVAHAVVAVSVPGTGHAIVLDSRYDGLMPSPALDDRYEVRASMGVDGVWVAD